MTGEVVLVSGIAAGGDGVGRLADGRAVFVPRTAPGDRVRLRDGSLRVHRHFARAEAGEIEQPAPARVTATCPHYSVDRCGGCQLQHLSYDAQLAAKRAIVGQSLRRIAKLAVADPEIVRADAPWRYRTEISLQVQDGRRRGWTGEGSAGASHVVGLHPYDRPGAVFPLVDCEITDLRLMALWRDVRQHLDLFPNRLTRVTLRLDRDGARHVIAESSGEPWLTAERLRQALADGSMVCWWRPTDGAARVVAGPATGFPATAFEEENPVMGVLVRQWAVEQLGDVRGLVAWDLYGRIGDMALVLAGRGATVVSVDADEQAIAWARQRPESAVHGKRLRFIAARAEDVLPSLPEPQVVVVDPPRTGLPWDLTLRLGGDPVGRLVYLATDPATLARDLHRLSVNYHLRAVQAFDQFPQTAWVRTAVHLEAVT
ncbi:MAG: class I SAM-dependent RNA methyltransferase [Gemmatimonadales bacterium]